jgi:hypothetical protein
MPLLRLRESVIHLGSPSTAKSMKNSYGDDAQLILSPAAPGLMIKISSCTGFGSLASLQSNYFSIVLVSWLGEVGGA